MSIGGKKDDISIIKASIEGDRRAQKRLYETYAATMYAICLRYLRNESDAKDAMQNGYMKVFKNIHKFQFKGSFEGWMKRIFVNSSIELIRKRKLHLDVNEIEEYAIPSIVEHLGSNVDYENMLAIVNQLPSGYRTVFNMYVVDGFSHQEIAEQLEISESTSKSQLFKARKQLQSQMSILFGSDVNER